MTRPLLESVPVFYRPYIEAVKSESVEDVLNEEFASLVKMFNQLTNQQLDFAYAEGKWSLKQLLLHLIDTERIMSIRALRFCRNDRTELPGFDQDLYVLAQGLSMRTKKSLVDEFKLVRACTKALFLSMNALELKKEGIANGYVMSAQTLAFVIGGHAIHHFSVIKERYLNAPNFPH